MRKTPPLIVPGPGQLPVPNPLKDVEVEFDLMPDRSPQTLGATGTATATTTFTFTAANNDPTRELYALVASQTDPNYLLNIYWHTGGMYLMNAPVHHDAIMGQIITVPTAPPNFQTVRGIALGAAGAVTPAIGAATLQVGARVVRVYDYTAAAPVAGDPQDVTADFEANITVAGQIQQTAAALTAVGNVLQIFTENVPAGVRLGELPGYFGSTLWFPPSASISVEVTNLAAVANVIDIKFKARGWVGGRSYEALIANEVNRVSRKNTIPYWLVPATPPVVGANATLRDVDYFVTGEAAFVAKAIVGRSTGAFSALPRGGAFNTQDWANRAVPSNMWMGSALYPAFIQTEPKIPPLSHIRIDFTDTSGAPNTIRAAFAGYRLWEHGAPWSQTYVPGV